MVRNLYRRPSWVEANSRKQEGADKTLQSSHAHLRSARSSSRLAADGQPGTDSVTAQVTAIEECPTVWLNVIFLICGYEISRKILMEIMRGLCLWMLDLYWKLLNWRYFHSCGYVASESHRFLALLYRWVIQSMYFFKNKYIFKVLKIIVFCLLFFKHYFIFFNLILLILMFFVCFCFPKWQWNYLFICGATECVFCLNRVLFAIFDTVWVCNFLTVLGSCRGECLVSLVGH